MKKKLAIITISIACVITGCSSKSKEPEIETLPVESSVNDAEEFFSESEIMTDQSLSFEEEATLQEEVPQEVVDQLEQLNIKFDNLRASMIEEHELEIDAKERADVNGYCFPNYTGDGTVFDLALIASKTNQASTYTNGDHSYKFVVPDNYNVEQGLTSDTGSYLFRYKAVSEPKVNVTWGVYPTMTEVLSNPLSTVVSDRISTEGETELSAVQTYYDNIINISSSVDDSVKLVVKGKSYPALKFITEFTYSTIFEGDMNIPAGVVYAWYLPSKDVLTLTITDSNEDAYAVFDKLDLGVKDMKADTKKDYDTLITAIRDKVSKLKQKDKDKWTSTRDNMKLRFDGYETIAQNVSQYVIYGDTTGVEVVDPTVLESTLVLNVGDMKVDMTKLSSSYMSVLGFTEASDYEYNRMQGKSYVSEMIPGVTVSLIEKNVVEIKFDNSFNRESPDLISIGDQFNCNSTVTDFESLAVKHAENSYGYNNSVLVTEFSEDGKLMKVTVTMEAPEESDAAEDDLFNTDSDSTDDMDNTFDSAEDMFG